MHLAFLVRDKRMADGNAVAVIRGDFRKVGYLSEVQASTLAPHLGWAGSLQVSYRVHGSAVTGSASPAALRKALGLN